MRFLRQTYYRRQYFRRFLRPINRLRMSPDHVGMTVAMGVLIGLCVPPGCQLAVIGLFWLVGRQIGWSFNFPIALLLTGISNPLTFAPIYSFYYVAACTVVECHTGSYGVEAVLRRFYEEPPWRVLADAWPIVATVFLGSLPFGIAGAVGGYHFGQYVGRRMQQRRQKRQERRDRARFGRPKRSISP